MMSAGSSGVLDKVRRPEYTGENRCMPCTIVNVVLAGILSALVGMGLGVSVGVLAGVLGGLGVLLIALGSISLRGYLVPGTPWLTKTYFPDRVLKWFETEPPQLGSDTAGTGETDTSMDSEIDVEGILLQAGAVAECADADDLCLTEAFETAWQNRIDQVRGADTERSELATVLDVDPEALDIAEYGEAFVARVDGRTAGQWESHAAFLADVAAARELRSRYEPWSDMNVRERSTVLDGLRLFLERCPACGGSVGLGEDVVESCCRSIDVVAVTCQECDSRLFEAEHPG